MDVQRNILIIIILFLSFILWKSWNIEKTSQSTISNGIENISTCNKQHIQNIKESFITVITDVLSLKINVYGGDIEQACLLSYAEKLNSCKPFALLQKTKNFIYQTKSGLMGPNGIDNLEKNQRPVYTTNQNVYILSDNQQDLHVPLIYTDPNGVIYTKTFILKRGSFAVKIQYNINNISMKPLHYILFGTLQQSIDFPIQYNTDISHTNLYANRSIAYSSETTKYKRYDFKDIKNIDSMVQTKKGWIAMLQQYFATAWIPYTKGNNVFYTQNVNNQVIIGFQSSSIIINAMENCSFYSILWIGPKLQDQLRQVSTNLDLVVDYGWLWFIAQPLFKLLKFINYYIKNWGSSIVVITFIVRSIMYPLTKAQYISMAKMHMLQPKLIEIHERCKNNKQKYNHEIIELYKTEKVNPFGGCLPLIIQMPIFLALYYMLSNSIELRHARFILWIRDLSAQDPYYILPIFMGMTMFLIQKMSITTINDPIQAKIVHYIPVIFTIFFLWFPSGLVLYYTVSNVISIIQQKIIYYNLRKIGLYK